MTATIPSVFVDDVLFLIVTEILTGSLAFPTKVQGRRRFLLSLSNPRKTRNEMFVTVSKHIRDLCILVCDGLKLLTFKF
jgi:hypothetical protein